MTIPGWVLGLGAAGVVTSWIVGYGAAQRAIGASKEQERAAHAEAVTQGRRADSLWLQEHRAFAMMDLLVVQAAVRDSAYRAAWTGAKGLIADLRHRLAALPDTGTLGAVKAGCTALADTTQRLAAACEARVATRDQALAAAMLGKAKADSAKTADSTRAAALERENAAVKKQLPGWFNRTVGTIAKLGIGGLGGVLACIFVLKCPNH